MQLKQISVVQIQKNDQNMHKAKSSDLYRLTILPAWEINFLFIV